MQKRFIFFNAILVILLFLTGCQLPVGNFAPEIAPIDDLQVTVGRAVNFTVNMSDRDGDVLISQVVPNTYSQYFNSTTRVFSWTPSAENIGVHHLTFVASDGQAITQETVNITVTNVENHDPTLNNVGNKSITEGQLLRFMVAASDQDGDKLTFAASDELTQYFDAESGVFNWQTKEGDAGVYHFTFTVSDGHKTVSENVTITVNAFVNVAPIIIPLANVEVNEGEQVGPILLNATDGNNDRLSWTIANGPGQIINGNQYIWVTKYTDSGLHDITVKVSDNNGGITFSSFRITVHNVNRSPEIVLKQADGSVFSDTIIFHVGQNNEFYVEATDPDGDSIKYSLEDWYTNEETLLELKNHFTLDSEAARGIFSWAPLPGDEGVYSLTFKVVDSNGASDLESVVITVQ